jgi:hypothetical protein
MTTGDEWLDQAKEHLSMITPGLQGEVLRQQVALALMQAGREGIEQGRLERELQACALLQLQQAIIALEG